MSWTFQKLKIKEKAKALQNSLYKIVVPKKNININFAFKYVVSEDLIKILMKLLHVTCNKSKQ